MVPVDTFVSQLAVESLSGIVVCDVAGTILFVNPQIEQTFGYQSAELVGRPVGELLSSTLPGSVRAGSRQGPASTSQLTVRRRDGSELDIDVERTVLERSEGPLTILSISETGERNELHEPTGSDRQSARRVRASDHGSGDAIRPDAFRTDRRGHRRQSSSDIRSARSRSQQLVVRATGFSGCVPHTRLDESGVSRRAVRRVRQRACSVDDVAAAARGGRDVQRFGECPERCRS